MTSRLAKNALKTGENGLSLCPHPDNGYARVMLVGSTGAGKTTLLRQLIGSDHKRDRFPSTSTAKTTTADIEIITAAGPFRGVITFMTEHEVRCSVDECWEEACGSVIRGRDDRGVAEALLEHREQRFRLSYVLGTWQQMQPGQDTIAGIEYLFDDDEMPVVDALADDEIVDDAELSSNNERLNRVRSSYQRNRSGSASASSGRGRQFSGYGQRQ